MVSSYFCDPNKSIIGGLPGTIYINHTILAKRTNYQDTMTILYTLKSIKGTTTRLKIIYQLLFHVLRLQFVA